MPMRMLGPKKRSHIGWGGKRNILYKGVEIADAFKNFERKPCGPTLVGEENNHHL